MIDLGRYWAVIRDHWILFLLGSVMTTTLAAWAAYSAPDVYEASGTFVVRPRVVEGGDTVRAIDALNRSVEIGSTYAFIARSDLIEDRAREGLEEDYRGLSVTSDLIAGTNVIEISVRGDDPVAVSNLALAVGGETVAYIADLMDAFELVPLDAAERPNRPVGPNRPLSVSLGVLFGVGVGSLLAMLAHLVVMWRQRPAEDAITDPFTGTYSQEYFDARFRQEVVRANRRRRRFSLGLMRTVAEFHDHEGVPPQTVMRQIALVLQGKLSDDDTLAYLGDGVFAMMLLHQDESRAEWQLREWRKELEAMDFTDAGVSVNTRFSVVVTTYGSGPTPIHSDDDALSVTV